LNNPDRILNCLRERGVLGVTVVPHGCCSHNTDTDSSVNKGNSGSGGVGAFRVVNMHLNIGVSNFACRIDQLQQIVRQAVVPYARGTTSSRNTPNPKPSKNLGKILSLERTLAHEIQWSSGGNGVHSEIIKSLGCVNDDDNMYVHATANRCDTDNSSVSGSICSSASSSLTYMAPAADLPISDLRADAFAGVPLPVVLCGDTNACATLPEPEMAWLAAQREAPLVDCWLAAGNGGPGWTWEGLWAHNSSAQSSVGSGSSSSSKRRRRIISSSSCSSSSSSDDENDSDIEMPSRALCTTNGVSLSNSDDDSRHCKRDQGSCGEALVENGGEMSLSGGNPLCESGPLLEPDQRTDVIYVTAPATSREEISDAAGVVAGCLVPVDCEVLVYPTNELLSDHYGVIATLGYGPSGEGSVRM